MKMNHHMNLPESSMTPDFYEPESITEMTMEDIVSMAKAYGFNPHKWDNTSHYHWNSSLECAAYDFLKEARPDLFEQGEDHD